MNVKLENELLSYYRKSIKFKKLGKWRDAANSDKMCAKLLKQLKKPLEAATMFTEAGFGYLKIDKTEALASLNDAIIIYCDHGRFDVAARLERKVADIQYINKHWEEAALHFRKAANFLSGEQMFDQCDSCLELAAYCFVEMKEYQKAAFTYVTIAQGCVQSNLRSFNARDFLFKAILALLAAPVLVMDPLSVDAGTKGKSSDKPSMTRKEKEKHEEDMLALQREGARVKYEEISNKIVSYGKIDVLWKCCKESTFLKNIVKYRLEWDTANFAKHLYYWNNVRPLDRQSVLMLKTVYDELEAETARLENVKLQEKRAKERARIKKEKLEKQKKLLKDMGVEGEAMVDDDEVEKELMVQEENEAKKEAAMSNGEGEAVLIDVDELEVCTMRLFFISKLYRL